MVDEPKPKSSVPGSRQSSRGQVGAGEDLPSPASNKDLPAPPAVLSGGTLTEMLEMAASGPGTIQFAGHGDPVKFSQLWSDAETWARWIRAKAGTGGYVGILLENHQDAVTNLLAVWRSGNALVSLPHPAPQQDIGEWREHVSRMCALAGVEHVFVAESLDGALEGTGLVTHTYGDPAAGGSGLVEMATGNVVQFTSGSVGSPKGVVLDSRAIRSNVEAMAIQMGLDPSDRVMSWLPLSHDMGFIGMFLCSVAHSVDLVMLSPKHFLMDPGVWLKTCSSTKATMTVGPNFALDLVACWHRTVDSLDLSNLRVCVVGSEKVYAKTLEGFTSTFAPAGFNPMAFCPSYGMAENSLAASMVRPSEHWAAAVALPGGGREYDAGEPLPTAISTGRAVPGTEIRIDGANAEGQLGEIQIRGVSLLNEYLGAPPPWTEDGWFRTKDLGFMRDGECYVVGRSDEVIVIRGRNLFPEDVERYVQHVSVRSHRVAAVAWGSDGMAILAEVTNAEGDLTEAGRQIAARIGQHTGVAPTMVAFVRKGELPRTPSGKIQRTKAKRQLELGGITTVGSFELSAS